MQDGLGLEFERDVEMQTLPGSYAAHSAAAAGRIIASRAAAPHRHAQRRVDHPVGAQLRIACTFGHALKFSLGLRDRGGERLLRACTASRPCPLQGPLHEPPAELRVALLVGGDPRQHPAQARLVRVRGGLDQLESSQRLGHARLGDRRGDQRVDVDVSRRRGRRERARPAPVPA